MSHNRIYQINTKPISEDDYICDSSFLDHPFVWSITDGISDNCDRSEDIVALRSLLTRTKAAKFDDESDSFMIQQNGKEAYFAKAYEAYVTEREKTMSTSLTEFASGSRFAESMRLMSNAFNEERGCYVSSSEGELVTLDEFIRFAEVGVRYFIGGTLDYHS